MGHIENIGRQQMAALKSEEVMEVKILALNGSPHGRRSNTDRLLLPLLEGASKGGARTEELYLYELDIRPCTGCFNCWVRTPGACVQNDDMTDVLQNVLDVDVLVWAFPLYCYGVPARVQALQERMLPLVLPQFARKGDVHYHPSRYPDRHWKWVVLNILSPDRSP